MTDQAPAAWMSPDGQVLSARNRDNLLKNAAFGGEFAMAACTADQYDQPLFPREALDRAAMEERERARWAAKTNEWWQQHAATVLAKANNDTRMALDTALANQHLLDEAAALLRYVVRTWDGNATVKASVQGFLAQYAVTKFGKRRHGDAD